MSKPVLVILLLMITLFMLGTEPGAYADPDHYEDWECTYMPAWIHSGRYGILPSAPQGDDMEDHDPFAPCKVTPTVTPTIEPTVTPTLTPTLEPTVTATAEPTVTPTPCHDDDSGARDYCDD